MHSLALFYQVLIRQSAVEDMSTKTQFKKGSSGNAAGRPVGSGLGPKVRQAISARTPELIEALLDQAIGGDVTAAQILLDRVCPKLKPESVVALNVASDAKRHEIAAALLEAVLVGTASTEQAASILALVHERDSAQSSADFEEKFGSW